MSHDSPPLTPAPPQDEAGEALCSIAWLEALRETAASAMILERMAEANGDITLWRESAAHYDRLIKLCRQSESASNKQISGIE